MVLRTLANPRAIWRAETESQAASLEETAAAVDEITVTVPIPPSGQGRPIWRCPLTRKTADSSSTVVNSAVAAMSRIEEASGKIESIIEVIDEIAFQTKPSGAHAGIEAARAGEAGKGFAVVAQEVRELAQRSASAAQEIKALINQSSNEVRTVPTGAAGREVLATISEQIAGASRHVESHRHLQSGPVFRAEGNQQPTVNKMDQLTQQNGAMVAETNQASERLAREAALLRELVQQFRIEAGLLHRVTRRKEQSMTV